MPRQSTTTSREGWLTIKIPRVEGRTWPGRPASPILISQASNTLKSLAVALEDAGLTHSARGCTHTTWDNHDAAQWLLRQVVEASEKAG